MMQSCSYSDTYRSFYTLQSAIQTTERICYIEDFYRDILQSYIYVLAAADHTFFGQLYNGLK